MTNRKAALVLLWKNGVFDPKPLLDDLGSVGGLIGEKDAAQRIAANTPLRDGLEEVLAKRLALQRDLIKRGYQGSVDALRRLVAEHQRLESGQAVDLAQLRVMVAQLRAIVDLLGKARRSGQ